MTESEYWQMRADRESNTTVQLHEAALAAIEEVKSAALSAVYFFEEAGRNIRNRS